MRRKSLALDRWLTLAYPYRRAIVFATHVVLTIAANQLAVLLRFDGDVPAPQSALFRQMLPWLIAVRAPTFFAFRLYEGVWRYAGIWDLRNIIAAVCCSTLIFYVLTHYILGELLYSRSVFIIDALLLICFVGGLRLTRRLYRELWRAEGERRVLIYGAGDAGEMIVREMKNSSAYGYEPVGFVDDDHAKLGVRIHGVPVLGTRDDLTEIIADRKPQEILIAIPRADAATIRGIVKSLGPHDIKITTLPNLREILGGQITVSLIRTLSPEDLLSRAPVGLDAAPIRALLRARTVLVTGAGGSIGSELCRQIAALQPERLVLLDRYENNLFAVLNDLNDRGGRTVVIPILGDIGDAVRIDAVMREHRPDIVFHAAAYKHVPLVEQNPCEAVKNNVLATRELLEAAERHAVDRFIFISTDKAVNPTSVMGATKRVAELMVQAKSVGSATTFQAVRFGNVLGSNGSVVPRFMEQIRAGGPITVTHPDMRRYFMLIPEAVQLVLHAAAHGSNGAIYVLDMGEQVKVVDMARDLIKLTGLIPDEDIQITYTGLRPGEKLCEELVGGDEIVAPSEVDKIVSVTQRTSPSPQLLARQIIALETAALGDRCEDVLRELREIVPTFRREPQVAAVVDLDGSDTTATPATEATRQRCPKCASASLYLSHVNWGFERWRRDRSAKRPFRCSACGWRGWRVPLEAFGASPVDPTMAPNLSSIDESLASAAGSSRAKFSPRDLN